MNDDRQIRAELRHIFKFGLLNSQVTAPIFIKIFHDVDALV